MSDLAYAIIAVLVLLQLMTMGMVAAVIQNQLTTDTNTRQLVRDMAASVMHMAGEPRAARVIEKQSRPTKVTEDDIGLDLVATSPGPRRRAPYGLRSR